MQAGVEPGKVGRLTPTTRLRTMASALLVRFLVQQLVASPVQSALVGLAVPAAESAAGLAEKPVAAYRFRRHRQCQYFVCAPPRSGGSDRRAVPSSGTRDRSRALDRTCPVFGNTGRH